MVVDFNDDFVPTIPAKDMFLNSNIRKLAKLPREETGRLTRNSSIRDCWRGQKSPLSYIAGVRIGVQLNTSMSLV